MGFNQIDGLPLEAMCGDTAVIVTGLTPAKVYGNDNKPTGQTDGWRVSVVAPGRNFTAISVKVSEGGVDLGGMSSGEISAANAAGKFVYVGFEDFTAKAYVGRDSNLGITATAASVFLVDANGKLKYLTGTIPAGGAHDA